MFLRILAGLICSLQLAGPPALAQTQIASTSTQDSTITPTSDSIGITRYSFDELKTSLRLTSTPVGYKPPLGPAMFTTLTYIMGDTAQPAHFTNFNIGPNWTLNWLTYIQYAAGNPFNNVKLYTQSGDLVNYVENNNSFAPNSSDHSVLSLISTNPVTYKLSLVNGTAKIFSASAGATGATQQVFLSQTIDPAGNTVNYHYDNQMRLTSVVDAIGQATTFTYALNASPLLITQITDPFGRSAQLSYDGSGRLLSITNVGGMQSSFQYDASSLINALTTPYGVTQFKYNRPGNNIPYLVATDPLGNSERVEFRPGAPGIAASDPQSTVPAGMSAPNNAQLDDGNSFYWNKLAHQKGAGNYQKARLTHWAFGSLYQSSQYHWPKDPVASVKYPLENRVWYNYSGTENRPIQIGRVLDDGSTQITRYAYNSLGYQTSKIDPLGRQTQSTFASNQIDPVAIQQLTAGNLWATTNQYSYNNQHLPLTYTDASGNTRRNTYNSAGQLTAVTNALNQTTLYQYNNLGYLTAIINPDGKTQVSLSYDAYGRVAAQTSSEGITLTYSYDNMDRTTKISYPDGSSQIYTWNNLDITAVTNRLGRRTQYAYDANRNLISIIDPLGQTTQYSYYPDGSLNTLTDPNGKVTSWLRDIEGRVTAKQYPDGHRLTYAYEATTSRLKSITDSLGQTKSIAYTLDDSPSQISYINSRNATPGVSFQYDAYFPRLTAMQDGLGATSWQYNSVGVNGALRMAAENGPFNNDTIGYQYDELGRLSGHSVDVSAETFAYDALNRLIGHNSPLGNVTLSYLGETSQLTGLSLGSGPIAAAWQYDSNLNDRRLLSITNSGAARGYDFTSNAAWQILRINETVSAGSAWAAKNWSYGYDLANRLVSASDANGDNYAYAYDPAANITEINALAKVRQYQVNEVNQVVTANNQTYSYDANGNLLNDGVRSYLWDAENRLLQIKVLANGNSYAFRYDGLSRRVSIIGKTGGSSTETRYLWCGDQICQRRNGQDIVQRRYYPEGEYLPGAGGLFYAKDHLGSVRDAVSTRDGSLAASYDYDPYGNPTQSSGGGATDFRYAGMLYLPGANLYLTLFRAYDPVSGRWMSKDPSQESGGLNLYAYVKNNPLSFVDKLGLWADDPDPTPPEPPKDPKDIPLDDPTIKNLLDDNTDPGPNDFKIHTPQGCACARG